MLKRFLIALAVIAGFAGTMSQKAEADFCAGTPCWTTSARPSVGAGYVGYNSTLKAWEWYDGTNWQQTQPPAIFWVDSYGAVGDASTDDTTAFANALTACSNAGGGKVQISAKQYFINSTITVPPNCMLIGNNQVGATRPASSFSNIKYLILLNSASGAVSGNGKTGNSATITLNTGNTNRGVAIEGIAIMPATMNRSPSTLRDYVDMANGFANNGTAISVAGESRIQKIAAWGFNKCVDVSLSGRLTVDGFLGDCLNGIMIDGSHDTSWIRNSQIAYYATVNGATSAVFSISAVANATGLYRITTPTWTTAGRPGSPTTGQSGYNTSLSFCETWSGAAWVQSACPAVGDNIVISGANINVLNKRWVVAAVNNASGTFDLTGSSFGGGATGVVSTTGTTTYGLRVVPVTSAANIAIGQTVSGTGIQGGTTVSAVWPSQNLVWLSVPASANGSVTVTFTDPALSGGTPIATLSSQIRAGGKAYSCTSSEGIHYTNVAAEGPDTAFYFGSGCAWPSCTMCAVDGNSTIDPTLIGVWYDSDSHYGHWQGYMTAIGRGIVNTSTGSNGGGNGVYDTNMQIAVGGYGTVFENSGSAPLILDGNVSPGNSYAFLADSAGIMNLGSNDFTTAVAPFYQSYSDLQKVTGSGTNFATANAFATGMGTFYPLTPQTIGSFVINGDMTIDQPHEAASFTTCASGGAVRLVDRWKCNNTNSGATNVGTWQRVATGTSIYPYALQLTVGGTAVATNAANVVLLETALEGNQFQTLNWSSNSGTPVVLDFCAKSSVTGTYGGWLRNTGGTFYYQFQYVISAANTWTCFSQNIPAPLGASGFTSPPANNAFFIYVGFDLGNGSNFNNATLGWTAPTSGTRIHLTSSVNITNTIAAVMAWTGVHLRAGTKQFADYQARDQANELNLAQRFYQKSFPPGTAPAQNAGLAGSYCFQPQVALATAQASVNIQFNPTMIASPTVTTYNPAAAAASWRDVTTTATVPTATIDPATTKSATGVQIRATNGTGTALAGEELCIQWSADTIASEN
jgi:hypothetical protein